MTTGRINQVAAFQHRFRVEARVAMRFRMPKHRNFEGVKFVGPMGSYLHIGLRQHFRIPSELPPSPSQRFERKSPRRKQLSASWTLAGHRRTLYSHNGGYPREQSCPSMIRQIFGKGKFAHRVSIQIPHLMLPKLGQRIAFGPRPRQSSRELEVRTREHYGRRHSR